VWTKEGGTQQHCMTTRFVVKAAFVAGFVSGQGERVVFT
jgi:hypothetical protein